MVKLLGIQLSFWDHGGSAGQFTNSDHSLVTPGTLGYAGTPS
jgi:hypothetical protein